VGGETNTNDFLRKPTSKRIMNRSTIAHTLEQLMSFLETDGPVLLPQGPRAALGHKATELLNKASKPGEVLYVGILGGTGVGKSTLINALARAEISHASDKRPFTDKAVVYRHTDTRQGLEGIAHLLRKPDALHESDTIRDLVLLDLPDFDSLETDNRRTVLEIIPVLDAIVWVLSPEKYADAAFYDFARQAAINPENFTFVLNKSDELIGRDGSDPHLKLKDMLGDLTFRLKDRTGIHQPRVFSLSAAYEFHGKTGDHVLDTEFGRFRDFLMVRRDAKEIASVKTANLVEQTRLLLEDLNGIVQPEGKSAIVAQIRTIRDETGTSDKDGPQSLELEHKLASALVPVLASEDRSVSPVQTGTRLLGYARSIGRGQRARDLQDLLREIGDKLEEHWSSELNHAANRTDSELLLNFRGAETSMSGAGDGNLMETARMRAISHFDRALASRLDLLGGKLSKWRRAAQKFVLWLPVVVLMFRLTGEHAVNSFLDHPGLGSAFRTVLTFLTSIFSSDGLTGLVALLICELLLIWYLAAARTRKIERYSRALSHYAIDKLNRELKSAAAGIREQREELLKRIERGLDSLNVLNEEFRPPKSGAHGTERPPARFDTNALSKK